MYAWYMPVRGKKKGVRRWTFSYSSIRYCYGEDIFRETAISVRANDKSFVNEISWWNFAPASKPVVFMQRGWNGDPRNTGTRCYEWKRVLQCEYFLWWWGRSLDDFVEFTEIRSPALIVALMGRTRVRESIRMFLKWELGLRGTFECLEREIFV